jgi:hypothetical protein
MINCPALVETGLSITLFPWQLSIRTIQETHTLPNLAVSCHPCNLSKANKLLPEAIELYLFNVEQHNLDRNPE